MAVYIKYIWEAGGRMDGWLVGYMTLFYVRCCDVLFCSDVPHTYGWCRVDDGWMLWKEINTSGYWGKRMYLHLMMFLFAPGSLAKIIVISLYFLLSPRSLSCVFSPFSRVDSKKRDTLLICFKINIVIWTWRFSFVLYSFCTCFDSGDSDSAWFGCLYRGNSVLYSQYSLLLCP